MKKAIIVLLLVMSFSINTNAQEKKKGPQAETKKEFCCAEHKNASKAEIEKCKAKAASCSSDVKPSTSAKSCKTDGSCCGGKASVKKG